MFVDKVKVLVKAGDGGNGIVSFRHEKFVERGGPDGGNGGNGGDVVVVASRNQDSLSAFRYQKQLQAKNGQNGGKRRKHGKSGTALEVHVPIGTVISNEENKVIADLTHDGDRAVIAKGGKGGFGNAHFASSTRQAPRVAEKGEPGESCELIFELKMIADVGLVGLPNAGKSTFLATVSNAHPEIANYPFTTLTPNLGVVDVQNTSLLIADIPGLIEGASKGKGLGDEFLRHVERTSVLVHLVDAYNDDIITAYKTIQTELKNYRVDLSKRPQVVALTKVDGLDSDIINDLVTGLKKAVPKRTAVVAISAKSGEGVKELLHHVATMVVASRKKAEHKQASELPVLTFEEPEDRWYIEVTDDGFIVTGKKLESFARRTDFSDYYASQRMRDILQKTGVINELIKKGIEPDQKIIIGDPPIGSIEY